MPRLHAGAPNIAVAAALLRADGAGRVAVATFVAFTPAIQNAFVAWDDVAKATLTRTICAIPVWMLWSA